MGLFVMMIPIRPVSGNQKPNSKFAAQLQGEAQAIFGNEQLLQGDLYARITWFHDAPRSQDIDNIAKRILDSLATIVYDDDRWVRKCLTEGIDTRRAFSISDRHIAPIAYERLLTLLGDPLYKHVLYIEIGELAGQRAIFGPIDGEIA